MAAPANATDRPLSPLPAPSRRLPWGALLTTLLAFALLLHFIRFTPEDLQRMGRNFTLPLGLALYGLSLAGGIFRALRLQALHADPLPPLRLLAITLQHQCYAALLPFRAGEAALPLLLKQEGIPMARSLALLLMARLLDLLALALILLLALAALDQALPPALARDRPLWLALLTLASVLLTLPLLFRHRLVAPLIRGSDHPLLARLPRRDWLQGRLQAFADGLESMSRRGMRFSAWLTLGIWGGAAASALLCCALLTPTLAMDQALAGWTLLLLLAHLPIHGFAALGTYEAAVVVVFTPLGLTPEEALAFALITHGAQILLLVAHGLLGVALHRLSRTS
ncbi:MAG: flippase-like domain-containing protein [Magnetococcales bacterium]|nr:flippase-like domain-containing protein [Magnetococcales bacterium]